MTTSNETLKQHQRDMFFIDIAPYVERGSRCVLWGKSVQDMSRGELIGVIGFLEASLDDLSKLARGDTPK